MKRKLKIVWICHFVNRELLDFYKVRNRVEFAPWVSETLKTFINDDDLSIFIIAPNILKNKNHEFTLQGINYCLYKYRSKFIPRKLFDYFALDYKTNFIIIKKRIKFYIDKINPDLIHLHGAENPYYSAAIFQFLNSFPVLVTIQGFIKDAIYKDTYKIRQRIKIETSIISKVKHFGIQASFIKDEILKINETANCMTHQYLRTKPYWLNKIAGKKKYDCVFFARVCIDKGIEDLLTCIHVIKKTKTDISLLVIGSVNKKYLKFLFNKCIDLRIEKNVKFIGYLPPDALYNEVCLARVSVLPTYNDIIPGTVIESMYMKIPVVAYGVGGLLDLNNPTNVITLVEKSNIKDLANSVLNCLQENENKNNQSKIELAYKKSLEFYDSEIIKENIKEIYSKILN